MTDRAKLLSKSNFLLGCDCPVKLKYFKSGYPSAVSSDSYLEFFADGGFMVEALARALFPTGLWIQPDASETPESATARMLDVPGDGVWFEPTFVVDGLLIRADILQRIGTTWRLIEVKAASFNSLEEPNPFRGKRGAILVGWRDYLLDVAFQTRVLELVYPKMTVTPELCLVDKSKTCLEEAIFNKVTLHADNDPGSSGPRATYTGDHQAFAEEHFLGFLNVRTEVDVLAAAVSATSERMLEIVADQTIAIVPPIGKHCRDCEYRNIHSQRNGFAQCWGELATGKPHIVDLFRADLLADGQGNKGNGIASLIEHGVSKLVDIPTKMIDTTKSAGQRQMTQIECTISGNEYLDPLLRAVLDACEYPLHFVDFETSRLAVPYHKGMQPYEQIAFQFSCHTIAHKGATELQHREWINVEDAFPSFGFVRELRDAIGDSGTMIVWSGFEQSTLKDIRVQMDRYKLGDAKIAAWVDALVPDRKNGGRVLDLMKLCSSFYYHPKMGGSVSIKYVLPAIWGSNSYLWCDPWFVKYFAENLDGAMDPYDTLIGENSDSEKVTTVDAVRDGIGAMRTYQEMMYGLSRSDVKHRAAVKEMLLQYCQLDTAAMVIIWKHWVTMLGDG